MDEKEPDYVLSGSLFRKLAEFAVKSEDPELWEAAEALDEIQGQASNGKKVTILVTPE